MRDESLVRAPDTPAWLTQLPGSRRSEAPRHPGEKFFMEEFHEEAREMTLRYGILVHPLPARGGAARFPVPLSSSSLSSPLSSSLSPSTDALGATGIVSQDAAQNDLRDAREDPPEYAPGDARQASAKDGGAALLKFPRCATVCSIVRESRSAANPGRAGARRIGEDSVLPFRAPVRQTISVFSLTGGAGRTSIAAGLARVLSASGKRVLLADTCEHSLLPRFFGAEETRQGSIRRFLPSSVSANRAIKLLSVAVTPFAGDDFEQCRILQEFDGHMASVERVIWDLGGAPMEWSAKVLCASPQILVPLLPNANSLMQLRATRIFLNRCHDEDPAAHIRYVLTHFDERDPLHVEMRGHFRKLLGSQLLPGAMRVSPLVDEALSRGKTVVDHAPSSPAAADLWRLAQQLGQIEAAEAVGHPGSVASAWSERDG